MNCNSTDSELFGRRTAMKRSRRQFLHLAAGPPAALPRSAVRLAHKRIRRGRSGSSSDNRPAAGRTRPRACWGIGYPNAFRSALYESSVSAAISQLQLWCARLGTRCSRQFPRTRSTRPSMTTSISTSSATLCSKWRDLPRASGDGGQSFVSCHDSSGFIAYAKANPGKINSRHRIDPPCRRRAVRIS